MAYVCPYCSHEEIKHYTLAGTYIIPSEDDGKHVAMMRWGSAFKPIAMISCPECGMISFMEVDAAQKRGMTRQAFEEPVVDKDAEDEIKEQLHRSDILLKNLSAKVKSLDEAN